MLPTDRLYLTLSIAYGPNGFQGQNGLLEQVANSFPDFGHHIFSSPLSP